MGRRRNQNSQVRIQTNALALAKRVNHCVPVSKRTRGASRLDQGPFIPTEDWHEPSQTNDGSYRVVRQDPGRGYVHAVTVEEVRNRLAQLPNWMLKPLEVVQLSRMTRKKQSFPCYGMQWGATLYLYPIEESLVEYFGIPPKPSVYIESRMYGGRWKRSPRGSYRLVWTRDALRDYYLDNILIHELGHLLDDRNNSYVDRERYAEWFAIEYGYKASRGKLAAKAARRTVRRRHHST